jgi:hypothetical protein
MRASTLLALSLVPLASCAIPRLDVMARYGPFDVDGDLGVQSGGVTATNSMSEAGIEEDDSVLGGRVDLDLGMPKIIVSGQRSDQGGDGTLAADLEFDGTTITAGSDVSTDFDLGLYNALFLFDLFPTDTFELAIGLGITAFDIDATFTEVGGPNEIDLDETLPVPVLAVNAGIVFGSFEVQGLLSGMKASYDDNDVTVVDLDAFGRWAFLGTDSRMRASLIGGYRYIDFDLEYEDDGDDVEFDASFNGPYVGLEFSF